MNGRFVQHENKSSFSSKQAKKTEKEKIKIYKYK